MKTMRIATCLICILLIIPTPRAALAKESQHALASYQFQPGISYKIRLHKRGWVYKDLDGSLIQHQNNGLAIAQTEQSQGAFIPLESIKLIIGTGEKSGTPSSGSVVGGMFFGGGIVGLLGALTGGSFAESNGSNSGKSALLFGGAGLLLGATIGGAIGGLASSKERYLIRPIADVGTTATPMRFGLAFSHTF